MGKLYLFTRVDFTEARDSEWHCGSGSGISWAMCKSAPRSRQMTTPALHHSFFTGWMPFLPPNQQRQSTEDKKLSYKLISKSVCLLATVDDHLKQLQ